MSNENDGTTPATKARVPAWKRIGLQLKYAKDTAEPQSSTIQDAKPQSTKTETQGAINGELNISNDPRPSKKRRLSPRPTQQRGDSAYKVNDEQQLDHSEFPADQQPAARRKSVTFSTDTKQDDGFSAKALFKQSTAAGQLPQVKESTEVAVPVSTTATGKREPRPRKKKSAKQDVQPQSSNESKELTGVLQYLDLFGSHRENWKFNKKRQTELLKHIFDVQRIPVHYNRAVLNYISGLQGAAARKQVIDNAFAVLRDITTKAGDIDIEMIESMESAEAKRNAYSVALKKCLERSERTGASNSEYNKQQLEEIQAEAPRAQRSDQVLFLLLNQELHPEEQSSADPTPTHPFTSSEQTSRTSTPAQRMNGTSHASTSDSKCSKPASKPKRKKRKARTQASTSDDSSNSDSDEGSSNQPTTGPRSIREALGVSTEPGAPRKKESSPFKLGAGKKTIFDDNLLDTMFPKPKSYHETAPKRRRGDKDKGRGFAYTHGTKADESESESE